jgi:hypothetical protein
MRNGIPKVVAMNWGSFKERPGILDGNDENDFNGEVGMRSIMRAIMPYIAPRIRGFYTKYPDAENPLVRRHAAR